MNRKADSPDSATLLTISAGYTAVEPRRGAGHRGHGLRDAAAGAGFDRGHARAGRGLSRAEVGGI